MYPEKFLKQMCTYESDTEQSEDVLLQKIEDIKARAQLLHGNSDTFTGLTTKSINVDDAKVLHALVRTVRPAAVFEIGTWIGTSAMIMADALSRNEGTAKVYTCDTTNCYSLPEEYSSRVIYSHAFSEAAIETVPEETPIDLLFADGELTFKTLRKLSAKGAGNTIIVTHDYRLPAEKGVLNLVRTQLSTAFGYELISPKELAEQFPSTCIAILIPSQSRKLSTVFKTVYTAIRLAAVKSVRKLRSFT